MKLYMTMFVVLGAFTEHSCAAALQRYAGDLYAARFRDCHLNKISRDFARVIHAAPAIRPAASRRAVEGSGVEVSGTVLQVSTETVFVSIVTAAFSAKTFPQSIVAPVVRVMLWSAIIVP